jgi:hypothetical protein
MILIRVAFLLLTLAALNVFVGAQKKTEENNAVCVYKLDEFDRLSDDVFKTRLNSFLDFLRKNKTLKGYILIFGVIDRETDLTREKVLSSFNWRREINPPRITIMKAKDKNKQITEFWVVPTGMTFSK